MSKPKVKDEFYVMKAFTEALPNIDASALTALVTWLRDRGEAEIKKRERPGKGL